MPVASSSLRARSIAFDVHGNVYALLVLQHKLALIDSDEGTATLLLDQDDGLWNPASLAFGTGKGERQSLFIANYAVIPPEPENSLGPAVLKVEVGSPGLPLPSPTGSTQIDAVVLTATKSEELASALDEDRTASVIAHTVAILRTKRGLRNVADELHAHASFLREVRNYGVHPRIDTDRDLESVFDEDGVGTLLMTTTRYLIRLANAVERAAGPSWSARCLRHYGGVHASG